MEQEQRDQTHVEQHGDGDVNIDQQDTGSAEDVAPEGADAGEQDDQQGDSAED